ncbi:MAG: hypothetical protein PUA86_08205 [Clostridiaceae bacterium]|nr:hypothetical protein [Clostridiaceae bacterium]
MANSVSRRGEAGAMVILEGRNDDAALFAQSMPQSQTAAPARNKMDNLVITGVDFYGIVCYNDITNL